MWIEIRTKADRQGNCQRLYIYKALGERTIVTSEKQGACALEFQVTAAEFKEWLTVFNAQKARG